MLAGSLKVQLAAANAPRPIGLHFALMTERDKDGNVRTCRNGKATAHSQAHAASRREGSGTCTDFTADPDSASA